MVVKGDQEKIKTLIKDTITLLCRNGLTFKNEFSIEALIGITLDKDDVFLVNINEIIRTELGEKLAASNQQTEEGASSEEAEAWDDASGDDTSQIINSPSRKRRRKRKQSADADASNASFPEDLSSHSEPPSKKESTSIHKNIKHENDEDSNDLVFVKQEVDNDWNSRTFLDHSEADRAPQQQDIMQGSLLPTSTQGINTVAGDGTQRSGTSATSSSQNMQNFSMNIPFEIPDSMTWQKNHPQRASSSYPLEGSTCHSQGGSTCQSPSGSNGLQCPECNKTFHSAVGFKTHVNRHRGIFPYVCAQCNKGFTSSTNYKGHLAQHTGIKQFSCPVCQKEYTFKGTLKEHILISHPELMATGTLKDML